MASDAAAKRCKPHPHRWDSFTLNTPRWQSRLPGDRFGGDADGFMPKDEIVARFEELARRLPVRYGARVVAIERDSASGIYVMQVGPCDLHEDWYFCASSAVRSMART
jgi:cation diffusion facilitator CzcD-associated flavoprotein CzcO